MSVALAAHSAGGEVVGMLGRRRIDDLAEQVEASVLSWDDRFPGADLVLVAVRDDAIAEVAERIGDKTEDPIVHMSGVAGLDVLSSARRGSFHPLQTLPDPATGADRLAGAGVAVAGSDPRVVASLYELAELLGMHPFSVDEQHRALYHAAAAAASNFVVTALAIAHRLFREAGVDPSHAEPLTVAVVDNVHRLGVAQALTGPVARGDVATVAAHLAAIAAAVPEQLDGYRAMVSETARVAGTSALFEDMTS